MRKIHLLFILVTGNVFCQTLGGNTTDINNSEELHFQSVEKSMKVIKASEINNYNVIDTINKLEALLNKNTEIISISIKNPEAYLIQNFENKRGRISIAIKNNEEFRVYEVLPPDINYDKHAPDSLNSDKKILRDLIIPAPVFKIKGVKRVRLDKSGSEELVIKFSWQAVGCPDCNQSQATAKNGYLVFDFDKLQLLKIINFDATTLTQQLAYLENAERFPIAFRKNYVKIKKRKYLYRENRLIRK